MKQSLIADSIISMAYEAKKGTIFLLTSSSTTMVEEKERTFPEKITQFDVNYKTQKED